MIRKLFKREPKPVVVEAKRQTNGIFSTDVNLDGKSRDEVIDEVNARTFLQPPPTPVNPPAVPVFDSKTGVTRQAMDSNNFTKAQFSIGNTYAGELLLAWYSEQGFIGSQTCALISQHWLVDKACTMPGKDAARNGYKITRNDGLPMDPKIEDAIRQYDKKFRIKHNLVQFSRFSRIFGIRILKFNIEVDDPVKFYGNPFNIDGVPPKSYKGITQIDPYWITPLLDADASGNPASEFFYEPTWWVVNGMKIHRTHLIITRTNEVPDVLKPTYIYAGISLPQRIYERIYGAERTANEAPLLSMTKRVGVLNVDTSQAIANQQSFQKKLEKWALLRDNFGVHALGLDEKFSQTDTSLTDLDAVIMTQYQIVAAIAEIPAVKLMGTSPKGFNASGEYEWKSYHEYLESIQSDEMEPVLDRHHMLLIKSWIAPGAPFDTSIKWNSLDIPTAAEEAVIKKSKAETAVLYAQAGAIDGIDIRKNLAGDIESDFSDLKPRLSMAMNAGVTPEENSGGGFEEGNDPDYEEAPENEGNPDRETQ